MRPTLVTGAGGALGRIVVAQLRSAGTPVVATARNPQNGEDYVLDVTDKNAVATIIQQTNPEVILHLAASFGANFEEAYHVNVASSYYILSAVRAHCPDARVLLVGSAAEYGVVHPEENPIREDHVLRPVSTYGLTKAWQTQLASYFAAQGVHVVIARLFNLDGKGLSERLFVGRLHTQIEAVCAGEKKSIELGNLSAIRDYVDIETAAHQLQMIAAHGYPGEIYHVASGQPISMRNLMNRHLSAHGLDISMVKEDAAHSNRAGYDVPVIYADISKTNHILHEHCNEPA